MVIWSKHQILKKKKNDWISSSCHIMAKTLKVCLVKRIEDRGEDIKYFCFLLCWLVGGVKKLRDKKLICLVENKNETIESIVCMKAFN